MFATERARLLGVKRKFQRNYSNALNGIVASLGERLARKGSQRQSEHVQAFQGDVQPRPSA